MYLKQSTAVTLVLPRFVDDIDGKTAETALTIAQADVRLSKNAAAFAQKGDATTCTHMEAGFYSCPINTTDTGTLGLLTVAVSKSGALPVERTYLVVPANVYDSLVAGSDKLQTDAVELNSSASNMANLAEAASGMIRGTVDTTAFSTTATEFEADDIVDATADHYNGRVVVVTSGNLRWQATRITDYALVSGRGHFTVDALTGGLGNNDTFIIV